mgnify:CR=1 FL=1
MVKKRVSNTKSNEGKRYKYRKVRKARKHRDARRKAKTRRYQTPTLLQQMKDNAWMKQLLIKKANGKKMTKYEHFLYNAMISQPLPKGGIQSILNKYIANK